MEDVAGAFYLDAVGAVGVEGAVADDVVVAAHHHADAKAREVLVFDDGVAGVDLYPVVDKHDIGVGDDGRHVGGRKLAVVDVDKLDIHGREQARGLLGVGADTQLVYQPTRDGRR